MPLTPLLLEHHEHVAEHLARYWKSRGMDQHDWCWAMQHLTKGHNHGAVSGAFFLYRTYQGREAGLLSLAEYDENIAEIRDEIILPGHPFHSTMELMLKAAIVYARHHDIRKLHSLALPPTKDLYASAGFVQEGALQRHFREGEHLAVMSLFL